MIGRRIGVFEVQSLLGAGGMGEVYRARDSRLGRDVAIKILPPAWTADADRLARLEREARMLAALNHPHIAAIYGIEDEPLEGAGRLVALVLELVDGHTLAERLAGPPPAPLPIADSLDIARQLVDALDAAHERGIIHRDLKPANIKITPDGIVKILDFGLAKPMEEAAGFEAPTVSPASFDGAFIGTPAYMSPEQARGRPVDKRADIWAFGCVLYEMLTGRMAFFGETVPDTIVEILQREPDWTALPAATPPGVRRVLERCLTKDPRRRLRDIGDARDDLAQNAEPRADVRTPAEHRAIHFLRLTDFVGVNESPAISPDGRMVAFVAVAEARRHIWIQLSAGGAPLRITHDDVDHDGPRWVSDSTALIYFVPAASPDEEGTIWEISAIGGNPRPIAPALGPGDVNHTGDRIAAFQFRQGAAELVTFDRDGSNVWPVMSMPDAWDCSSPRWSPDDRSLAFHASFASQFDERLFLVAAGGGEARSVHRAGSMRGLAWVPDGSGLVCSSSYGSTVPYPPSFNLRLVRADGTGDQALTYGDDSYIDPDVHRSGKLVASRMRVTSDIWRFPIDGSPAENVRNGERITRQSGQVQTPSVSPDGKEIVYLSDNRGHGNLWIMRVDGTSLRQITFERDPDVTIGVPEWSPSGKHIVYVVTHGPIQVWITNTDGRGQRQLVPAGFAPSWSSDGEWVYYVPVTEGMHWRIEKISIRTGQVLKVRDDGRQVQTPAPGPNSLSFAARPDEYKGGTQWEIRRASPEDAPSVLLASVGRGPVSPLFVGSARSPDDRWLALPLIDGATTNITLVPTTGGAVRKATDFGERHVIIARRVSWSPDSRFVYAAVAEARSDVVLLNGLISAVGDVGSAM